MMKIVEGAVTVKAQGQGKHEKDVDVGAGRLFLPSSKMLEREQEVHPRDVAGQLFLFLLSMMVLLVETVDDP